MIVCLIAALLLLARLVSVATGYTYARSMRAIVIVFAAYYAIAGVLYVLGLATALLLGL